MNFKLRYTIFICTIAQPYEKFDDTIKRMHIQGGNDVNTHNQHKSKTKQKKKILFQ